MKKRMQLLFVTILCTAAASSLAASSFQLKADVNWNLLDAIYKKNVANVKHSIENGADVNSPREYQIEDYVLITSPLEFAIIGAGFQRSEEPKETPKSDAIVKILIEKGAKVNPEVEHAATWTPFTRAVMQENSKIVEILLEAGARAR